MKQSKDNIYSKKKKKYQMFKKKGNNLSPNQRSLKFSDKI